MNGKINNNLIKYVVMAILAALVIVSAAFGVQLGFYGETRTVKAEAPQKSYTIKSAA